MTARQYAIGTTQPGRSAATPRLRRIVIALLVAQALLLMTLLTIGTRGVAVDHAIAQMGLWLVLVWVVGFGSVCVLWPGQLVRVVALLPGGNALRFVLGCTLLALTEEAITTGLSNLHATFGDPTGEAMITASRNYPDVVLTHSVIVFVPMFVTWAWMLRTWDFTPFQVLILFGVTGTICEVMMTGPQQLLGFGAWIMIYGLMVYIPVLTAQNEAPRRPPIHAWPTAVILPILSAIPVALIVMAIQPFLSS